jgi:coenzyme F420-reducing hydrogenase gamma subunit
MTASIKPKIAFFDFTGCEGCQLTVIDALQTHPDLLGAVEIVQFREAMSEKGEDYQIAFVEGSCARTADEERLRAIRAQAQIVVALGACAHLGGVNALRNRQSLDEVRQYVYGPGGRNYDVHKALPISAVIEVDCAIPGCPIDRREFLSAVKALLLGRLPRLPDYPVCAECKLVENACLFVRGIPCLGSVTRAGCGAICPGYGVGCEGCRGLVPDPNLEWLRAAAREHGVSDEGLDAASRLFLSHELVESELEKVG